MQATFAWLASTAQRRPFFAFSATALLIPCSLQTCFSLLSLRLSAVQGVQQDNHLLAVASSTLWRLRTAGAALFRLLRWRLALHRAHRPVRSSSPQVLCRQNFNRLCSGGFPKSCKNASGFVVPKQPSVPTSILDHSPQPYPLNLVPKYS